MKKVNIQELKDAREAAWNLYIEATDNGAEAAWKDYLVTRSALYNARGKTLSSNQIKELKENRDYTWTNFLNAEYEFKFTRNFVVTRSAFTESPEWDNHIAAAKITSDAWTAYFNAHTEYNNAKERIHVES